jgi:hypothetical protein
MLGGRPNQKVGTLGHVRLRTHRLGIAAVTLSTDYPIPLASSSRHDQLRATPPPPALLQTRMSASKDNLGVRSDARRFNGRPWW